MSGKQLSDIPTEILQEYDKLVKRRKIINQLIGEYTSQWVVVQKKIIEFQDLFDKVKNAKK